MIAKNMKITHKLVVEMDLVEGVTFNAFELDSGGWNGFACPGFTKDEAMRLVEHMPHITYKPESNVFIVDMEDDAMDGDEVYEGVIVSVNGVDTEIFAIGAWGWVWGCQERIEL